MNRKVTFNTGDKSCHLEIENSHPYVISAGSPGRIKRVAHYLDGASDPLVSDRGLVTVHGSYKGLSITAFSTGMGPASTSLVLPEVIEACDNSNMVILRLGTSGGLQEYLNAGDFVISTDVERAESTSNKIIGKFSNLFGLIYKAKPNFDVILTLEEVAKEYKLPFQKVFVGRTKVTNEAYFSALKRKRTKSLAVSMEFSVYNALRDKYNNDYGKNIKTGNLLMVSDPLGKDGETPDMSMFLENQKQLEEVHIKTGLETLLRMSK